MFEKLGKIVLFVVVSTAFSLVMAFPLKWCWNYVMPYLFDLKEILWGHAFCLSFICSRLISSVLLESKKDAK